MLKKVLAVLAFALIAVPTAAMAQTFTGTVSHMVIKVGAIDSQTMKYSQTNMVIQGVDGTIGWDANNLSLTLNDSGNGYATVVGDLTFMSNNVSLHFSGNLLVPASGKQYRGDVPLTGSFDTYDSSGNADTHTFSASGKVWIVLTRDTSGNVTKGVLTLKLSPYDEMNSTTGNPEIMSFTIPATVIKP